MDLVRIAARMASPRGVNWALVRRWAEGSSPSEFGWTFGGNRVSAEDIMGADAETLASLGVPEDFVQAAAARGYGPGEFDVFLADNVERIAEE